MAVRKWSKSFLSPSPSPTSFTSSQDTPNEDPEEDLSALQRSSHLTQQLDLSTREDRAIVPEANPFSLSRKRSADRKAKGKTSAASGNIQPAGNVRPASARKAQTRLPEDTFERKKGWTNGRGEPVPPVTKSKRKAVDDGSCRQIGGNRLSRDEDQSPSKRSKVSSSTPSTSPKKATAKGEATRSKNEDERISFHRLPRVSEGSESFPIIAGLARQRSLPTKAEKPQPDINLIVSGYGARVTSSSKKAGPFKPLVKPSKASSSLNARTPPTPTSQKPVSTTPSRPSPNSSEEPPPVPTVGAAVIEDDTSQPPPRTPSPPPLVRPSASGYASSAVTTLKTPTNTWRANAESSTPTTRTHAQLLEDMVANVPQGYNLHEQGDNATETDQILPSAPAHAFHDAHHKPSPCVSSGSCSPLPAAKRLAQFRFRGQAGAAECSSSSSDLDKHLTSHLSSHLPSESTNAAAADDLPRPPANTAMTFPPAFGAMNTPSQQVALPPRAPARSWPKAPPLPSDLTPKFSSSMQAIRPRSFHSSSDYNTQSYSDSKRSAPPQPRVSAYANLFQPRSGQNVQNTVSTNTNTLGKRRLTLAPSRTSYTSGAKVTTWEPTPLSQSRAVTHAPAPPLQDAYVPRRLRALQQASHLAGKSHHASPYSPAVAADAEEDEDWEADWRPTIAAKRA